MIDLFSFLFLAAIIIFVGVFGELIFSKTGVPDVLWLVLLGIIAGPVLGIISPDILWEIAPVFSALALIVILFEGGLHLNIYEVFKESYSAFLLAFVSFFATMLIVALFYYIFSLLGIVPGFTLINGLLLGAIVGGSSSLIIMPLVLHSNIRKRLVGILSIESALTDVFAIVIVLALISFAVESATGSVGLDLIVKDIAAAFAVGLVVGGLFALVWLYVMKVFNFFSHELLHHYMLTFAAMLVLYAGVDAIGGSAALAMLTFGLVLGNAPQVSAILQLDQRFYVDRGVKNFNAEITFFIKTFFFALIGMMFVLEIVSIAIGVLIAVLAIGIRFLSVRIFSFKEKLSWSEKKLVSTVVPRGLAAAVLAIMPFQRGIPGTESFVGYAFTVIVVTIIVSTFGFYLFSRENQQTHFSNQDTKPIQISKSKKTPISPKTQKPRNQSKRIENQTQKTTTQSQTQEPEKTPVQKLAEKLMQKNQNKKK